MFENMRKPTQKDTWQSIGSVARILAGKLLVARELKEMAAAPAPVGKVERDGQGGLRGDAAIGEKGGRAIQGRNMARPCATTGRSGAQIGGRYSALTELKFAIVGISPAPGWANHAPALLGRASLK